MSLSIMPILAKLLHPLYSLINAAVLGKHFSPEELAGFGLGSVTVGLLLVSIESCFGGGAGTFIAQAHG